MAYRLHEVTVLVALHDSVDVDRDEALLESIRKEIGELATGDCVVIKAV